MSENELVVKKRGKEFREDDINKIEQFHQHCLDNCLQGSLICYSMLWSVARKFRRKQEKLNKKHEKK